MKVEPASLDSLSRDELIRRARSAGAQRPEVLTRVELKDEIVRLSEDDETSRRQARGWLGVARDLVASVVEQRLNMPDAAAFIRKRVPMTAVVLGPPVATVTLAEIYASQGHLTRALKMLDEVLENEPDHAAASQLRERLRARVQETGAQAEPPEQEPSELVGEADSPGSAPAAEPVVAVGTGLTDGAGLAHEIALAGEPGLGEGSGVSAEARACEESAFEGRAQGQEFEARERLPISTTAGDDTSVDAPAGAAAESEAAAGGAAVLLVSRISALGEELGDRAGAEGARRPSGGEEGEAACRGRCGGGPASPANKKQRGPQRVPDWVAGDARAVTDVSALKSPTEPSICPKTEDLEPVTPDTRRPDDAAVAELLEAPESARPARPNWVTKPAMEPVGPAGATEHAQPNEPVEPAESIQLTQPAEPGPSQATELRQPAEPGEEATQAAELTQPTGFAEPIESAQLTATAQSVLVPTVDALMWWSDSAGIHVYWEVTAETAEYARTQLAASLSVKLVEMIPGWEKPERVERELAADAASGHETLEPVAPGTVVRAALGAQARGRWIPLALGVELVAESEDLASALAWVPLGSGPWQSAPDAFNAARNRALACVGRGREGVAQA